MVYDPNPSPHPLAKLTCHEDTDVMQAVVTNSELGDIALRMLGTGLAGRADNDYGEMQRIPLVSPLYIDNDGALAYDASALQDQIDDLNDVVSALQDRITELEGINADSRITAIETTLGTVAGTLTSLQEQITNVQNEVTWLSQVTKKWWWLATQYVGAGGLKASARGRFIASTRFDGTSQLTAAAIRMQPIGARFYGASGFKIRYP